MGAHVVTWSMTSTVTVKTGGKERPATRVTANVMRPRATMAAPAMTKEMLSSACVLEAGKEQPAT